MVTIYPDRGGISPAGTPTFASLSVVPTSASAAMATLSVPSGSTLVSWDLRYREVGSETWLDYAMGLTETTQTVTGLTPSSETEWSRYEFLPIATLETAGSVQTITMPIATVLPVATPFAYVSPGGLRGVSTVPEGGTARICDIELPLAAPLPTFRYLDIYAFSTLGSAYDVTAIYVGPQASTDAITEDISTGFRTIFADGRTVAGGAEPTPGITRLTPEGGFDLGASIPAAFRCVVELPEGAELRQWGIPRESTGWDTADSNDKMGSLPSVAWSFEGRSSSFGSLPNLMFVLRDCSRNIVSLWMFGDSHIQGYGDGGITGTGGLAYRWAQQWASAEKAIVPVQLGLQGLATTQIKTLMQAFKAEFDIRCALIEAVSVNNYNDGFGFGPNWGAQAISDAGDMDALMGGQPTMMLIPGTWDIIANDASKAADYKATVSALKIAYSGRILAQSEGGVWDADTLAYLSDYGAGDGVHMSSLGYDQWAALTHSPLTSWIEAQA